MQRRSSVALGVDSRLLVLLVAALVVRLALLWGAAGLELKIVDEQHYHQLGRSLARGHGFAWPPGTPTSIRPPAYPFFIAGVWWLTGRESLQAVRAAQVALSLLTVVLVYRLGRLVFDDRTAFLAAAIVAFYPSLLFAGILLLSETLFTLFVVLTAWAFARLMRDPQPAAALGVGAALGLAALTRSVLWPFPILLVPLTMLSVRATLSRRALCGGLVLLGYLLVVTPWAVRNTRLQGTFTVVDTMGGLNLRMGNYAHTPEDRTWDAISLEGSKHWAYEMPNQNPDRTGWTEGRKDQWARTAALTYMRENPMVTFRRSVLKLRDFWGLERELIASLQQRLYSPPLWFAVLSMIAVTVSYPTLLLAGVLGACLRSPADWRMHAFLLLIVAFVCGIHAIVFGHSRYHLPLVPLIALYAARIATVGNWRELFESARRAVLPVALACMFVAMWAQEIFVRDANRISNLLAALLWPQ